MFVAQYRGVLTDQETAELKELKLSQDTVYYAADIITRTDKSKAVTNCDDHDGYYVLKAKD